jgi:excisionase family DNA binding protein
MTTSDLLTITEAARRIKRARLTIYRWIEEDKIVSVKFGDRVYIPVSEVVRIQKGENK